MQWKADGGQDIMNSKSEQGRIKKLLMVEKRELVGEDNTIPEDMVYILWVGGY